MGWMRRAKVARDDPDSTGATNTVNEHQINNEGQRSNINSLPNELLLLVFYDAIQSHDNCSAVLAVTCRRWRNIVIHEPKFWGSILLGSCHPLGKYRLWTMRIGTHSPPRRISLIIRGGPSVYIEPEWIQLFDALKARTYTIQSFHFHGNSESLSWANLRMGGFLCEEIYLHLDDRLSMNSSISAALSEPTWPTPYPPPLENSISPKILSFRQA
ncbi:hypothetical protein SISNIDRAFT_550446, partial [Sistotremastrum niveocremeum HHB9708]